MPDYVILQTRVLWPVTAALAVVAAAAGIAHVRHRPSGFLPRGLVTRRPFALAAAAGFTLFAAYLIIQFAAPRLIAQRYDLNATQIGLVLLPTGAMSATLSYLAGRLAGRMPSVRIIVACATASAGGLLLTATAGRSAVPLVVAVGLTVSAFSAGGSLGSAVIGGLSGALALREAVALLAFIPLAGILCATGIDSGRHMRVSENASDPGVNEMNAADEVLG